MLLVKTQQYWADRRDATTSSMYKSSDVAAMIRNMRMPRPRSAALRYGPPAGAAHGGGDTVLIPRLKALF